MPDILHRVELKSAPHAVYNALTATDGLSSWWTHTTMGDAKAGGTLHFQFGDRGYFDMKVLELIPNKRVAWQVTGGPPEWIGTKVSFDLNEKEGATAILFKHAGWKEPVEFMHHCSTKWAMFLMSLKAFAESGKGQPYPDDVHITVHAD